MLSYGLSPAQWDPFADLRQLQSQMNRMFDTGAQSSRDSSWPPVNMWLGDDSVVMTAEMPGVAQDGAREHPDHCGQAQSPNR